MGFGLLLIGYFTATMMSFNSFGGVFKAVGTIIMCRGAKKLSQYDSSFFILLAVSVAVALLSVICAVADVSSFLYNNLLIPAPLLGESVTEGLSYARLAADLITVAVLCYCVRHISVETGAVKTAYTPVRNFIFYCLFFLLQAIVWLASFTKNEALLGFVASTALPVWMVIINIVCILLNCLMLFSCYARICDESDVDMPQKPSRFAFVNKMREEKEEKRRKYEVEREASTHKSSNYSQQQLERAAAADRAKKKKR